MDAKELIMQANAAFPDGRKLVRKYLRLLDYVKYYGKLMERPDSPWVCTAYNIALSNLERFREKYPDFAEWIEHRREPGTSRKEGAPEVRL